MFNNLSNLQKILSLLILTNILVGVPILNSLGLTDIPSGYVFDFLFDLRRIERTRSWWFINLILILSIFLFKDNDR